MDAVKYLKEITRMCTKHETYEGCPIADHKLRKTMEVQEPERIVAIVEKWAKEHPVETRQSRFLKEFPNTSIYVDGTIDICPLYMDETIECKAWAGARMECRECERKYWSEEIEDGGN